MRGYYEKEDTKLPECLTDKDAIAPAVRRVSGGLSVAEEAEIRRSLNEIESRLDDTTKMDLRLDLLDVVLKLS